MTGKGRNAVPPRPDRRRALNKTTGARAVTFLNKSKLREATEKPAAVKILAADTKRAAAARAMREKRMNTARGRIRAKKRNGAYSS